MKKFLFAGILLLFSLFPLVAKASVSIPDKIFVSGGTSSSTNVKSVCGGIQNADGSWGLISLTDKMRKAANHTNATIGITKGNYDMAAFSINKSEKFTTGSLGVHKVDKGYFVNGTTVDATYGVCAMSYDGTKRSGTVPPLYCVYPNATESIYDWHYNNKSDLALEDLRTSRANYAKVFEFSDNETVFFAPVFADGDNDKFNETFFCPIIYDKNGYLIDESSGWLTSVPNPLSSGGAITHLGEFGMGSNYSRTIGSVYPSWATDSIKEYGAVYSTSDSISIESDNYTGSELHPKYAIFTFHRKSGSSSSEYGEDVNDVIGEDLNCKYQYIITRPFTYTFKIVDEAGKLIDSFKVTRFAFSDIKSDGKGSIGQAYYPIKNKLSSSYNMPEYNTFVENLTLDTSSLKGVSGGTFSVGKLYTNGYVNADAFTGNSFFTALIDEVNGGDRTFIYKAKKNSYNISYKLNGGTHGSSHPSLVSIDETFVVSNPSRTGYTFAGWTITGMDSSSHTIGASVTTAASFGPTKETSYKGLRSSSGTVTFTANWKANVYSVKFDGNKPSKASTPLQIPTKTSLTNISYDASFSLMDASWWSLRGYHFDSTKTWGTSSSGGALYSNKQTVKNLTSENSKEVTLYLQWLPNKYTVQFHKNPPFGTDAVKPVTAEYDQTFSLLPADTFSVSGYIFAGWELETGEFVSTHDMKDGVKVRNLTDKNGGVVNVYARWLNENTRDFIVTDVIGIPSSSECTGDNDKKCDLSVGFTLDDLALVDAKKDQPVVNISIGGKPIWSETINVVPRKVDDLYNPGEAPLPQRYNITIPDVELVGQKALTVSVNTPNPKYEEVNFENNTDTSTVKRPIAGIDTADDIPAGNVNEKTQKTGSDEPLLIDPSTGKTTNSLLDYSEYLEFAHVWFNSAYVDEKYRYITDQQIASDPYIMKDAEGVIWLDAMKHSTHTEDIVVQNGRGYRLNTEINYTNTLYNAFLDSKINTDGCMFNIPVAKQDQNGSVEDKSGEFRKFLDAKGIEYTVSGTKVSVTFATFYNTANLENSQSLYGKLFTVDGPAVYVYYPYEDVSGKKLFSCDLGGGVENDASAILKGNKKYSVFALERMGVTGNWYNAINYSATALTPNPKNVLDRYVYTHPDDSKGDYVITLATNRWKGYQNLTTLNKSSMRIATDITIHLRKTYIISQIVM